MICINVWINPNHQINQTPHDHPTPIGGVLNEGFYCRTQKIFDKIGIVHGMKWYSKVYDRHNNIITILLSWISM